MLWILLAGVSFVVFLLLMPLWFGAAAQAFLPQGVEIGEVKRLSWSRFELKEVAVDQAGVKAKVDSVEAYYPASWLKEGFFGDHETPFVSIGVVEADIEPTEEAPETESGELALPGLLRDVSKWVAEVDKWMLPHLLVEKASVTASGQTVEVSDLEWKNRTASWETVVVDKPETASSISIAFPESEPVSEKPIPVLSFSVANANFEVAAEAELRVESETAFLVAEMSYKENVGTVEVSWPEEGVMPNTVNWKATDWDLSNEDAGIPIEDTRLRVSATGDWDGETFRSDLEGTFTDEAKTYLAYPLDFTAQASGDFESILLKSLAAKGPGLSLDLNNEVRYLYNENKVEGEGIFTFSLDMESLNFEDAKGLFQGELVLGGNALDKPKGSARFDGDAVRFREYEVESVDLEMNFDWPAFDVTAAEVFWKEGVAATISGKVDIEAQSLEGIEVSANLDKEVLATFLPETLSMESANFSATAKGDWSNPEHEGKVSVASFSSEGLHPLSLDMNWQGRGANVDTLKGVAANQEIALTWDGAVESGEAKHAIAFTELTLKRTDGQALELMRDSRLAVDLSRQAENLMAIDSDFELGDSESSLAIVGSLLYPEEAGLEVSLKNLNSVDWVQPWLIDEVPAANVDFVVLNYQLRDGKEASLDASFEAFVDWEEKRYAFAGKSRGAGGKFEIESITVSMDGDDVLVAQGDFPAPIDLATFKPQQIATDQEFAFSMQTKNSPLLSAVLTEATKYEFNDVGFSMDLRGPFESPDGNFDLAAELQIGEKKATGEGKVTLQLQASVAGEAITLSQLQAKMGGDSFTMTGNVALPEGAYKSAFEGKLDAIDWQKTGYALELPQSELSPLARLVPELIAPGGKITASIEGEGSEKIDGFVNVGNLNTRPLFPFGALRDITTQLKFKGKRVELEKFSGMIGRETINVSGHLDANDMEWLFDIQSENTPLVRQAGLLLRSTMKLKIEGGMEKGTDVTGTIALNDGLFAMNTSVFASGGGASGRSAESRPPYFSVAVAPLNEWRLDVALVGEQFMRVETPAAAGILSMDMKLRGTLEEPMLRGGVDFEDGNVIFPFATFEISQGEVVFRVDDPYTPYIQFQGSSRRFGYDLGVEISGEAFDPQILFTSSPALNSEQILLMVMAGENPEGAVNYSSSQRASKIGSYLSKGLLSSGGGGGIGSRLSVSSGENLSEQGKETLQVELLLSERVQLLGEYDEYDAWNAGLRFKILGTWLEKLKERKASKEAKSEE